MEKKNLFVKIYERVDIDYTITTSLLGDNCYMIHRVGNNFYKKETTDDSKTYKSPAKKICLVTFCNKGTPGAKSFSLGVHTSTELV